MLFPVFDEDNNLFEMDSSEIYTIFKQMKSRRFFITSSRGEFYFPTTIEQMIKFMGPHGFFQIDKNRIVNVDQIKSFIHNEIKVDGETYSVAKRRQEELRELIEKRSRHIKDSGQNH